MCDPDTRQLTLTPQQSQGLYPSGSQPCVDSVTEREHHEKTGNRKGFLCVWQTKLNSKSKTKCISSVAGGPYPVASRNFTVTPEVSSQQCALVQTLSEHTAVRTRALWAAISLHKQFFSALKEIQLLSYRKQGLLILSYYIFGLGCILRGQETHLLPWYEKLLSSQ